MRRFVLAPVLLLATAALSAQAPKWTTGGCDGNDRNTPNDWLFGHQEQVCELRRTVLPLVSGQIAVRGTNGGIEVTGEDRNDVALEVRLVAYGSSPAEAEKVMREVKIATAGTIHDEGPRSSGWLFRSGYSASYRLRVPRHLSAELHTANGGVDINHVEGVLNAVTTNGGLSLKDLAGDVHARTVNGGVHVNLTGDTWRGAGLSAQSVNGGISVTAPDHYSAHVVAKTVNGGISVDFPVTMHGNMKHNLDTNLGQGGPNIHLQTVNGGVSIARN
ncbi:MAG TPA: DUF4097 family beta strand repeat-containing protein [Acidobacteriaceae bacterium]|nr:DUF4097 family beta strand repeat-containing protein [Acidobacteriaceae bacterium]